MAVRQVAARVWPSLSPFEIACEANPPSPDSLDDFAFYAILGTWMEEDVVEATVRNAFVQGAERVFLVDNDSSDHTVERAVAAGAILAESWQCEVYNEPLRLVLMNAVAARISLDSGLQHIWWQWLDADEFPEGPAGLSLREYLGGLDRRFRVVGSTFYNHFPSEHPGYISGFHPLDFQPLAEEHVLNSPCPQPHWKHPLLRYDRTGSFIVASTGFHSATLKGGRLVEPVGGTVTHHFQFREESATRKRLAHLLGDSPEAARSSLYETGGNLGMRHRQESLDAVYRQEWGAVDSQRAQRQSCPGVHPAPWVASGPPRRWYEPEHLAAAKARAKPDH